MTLKEKRRELINLKITKPMTYPLYWVPWKYLKTWEEDGVCKLANYKLTIRENFKEMRRTLDLW